jgi:ADP-ribose pyrophosphatase YjhB (NUDIX family)
MELDPRLHFVVATAIVEKDGKFLIMKRAHHEKAFPDKWTVPGGKLVLSEYEKLPSTAEYKQWYNVIEWVLKKEVREEAALEIKDINYLTNLVFVRPDGYPVVTLSFFAKWESGEVVLCKDMTDYAWVSTAELKTFDLIEGIGDEIIHVEKLLKQQLS